MESAEIASQYNTSLLKLESVVDFYGQGTSNKQDVVTAIIDSRKKGNESEFGILVRTDTDLIKRSEGGDKAAILQLVDEEIGFAKSYLISGLGPEQLELRSKRLSAYRKLRNEIAPNPSV